MKLIDKYKAIQEIGAKVEMPYEVYCVFPREHGMNIEVWGNQICFGEDYVDFDAARKATEWLVDQLGGKVKWSKL